MERPRKIFLAHAREDKLQVRKLHADRRARGFDPWLDEIDLMPGELWKNEISKAIRQAGVFLACLSSRSTGKVGYVQNEFRQALSAFGERPFGSIYLIPVRLDDCEIPNLQIPDMGVSLQDIQWVDLWQEGRFDLLVKAIERALKGVNPLPARGETSTPGPVAEDRANDEARERVPPEITRERVVVGGAPTREAKTERVQTRKAERGSLPRIPIIVAGVAGAMGIMGVAFLPQLLDQKISTDNGTAYQETL